MKTAIKNIVPPDLAESGARFTPLGLELPQDMPEADWARIGHKLCRLEQLTRWWIGDWAAYGEASYGALKKFSEVNRIDYQTLRNLAWLSSSIELSRRRDNLEISKHFEVAALPPAEQDRWLEQAEKQEWSVAELRRQIRQSGEGDQNALQSDGPIMKLPSRACDELVAWLREQSPTSWDQERKQTWKRWLEPIVRFYEQL